MDKYERFVKGAVFADHPASDIILRNVVIPVISCQKNTSGSVTTYSDIQITEETKGVRYTYSESEHAWIADSDTMSRLKISISDLKAMTEQGLIDEAYLDALILTADEVTALQPDRNTNTAPEVYYIYDESAEPGTPARAGDVNDDGICNVLDLIALQRWLLRIPGTHLAQWRAADLYEDEKLDVFDLAAMKRMLLEQ